MLTPNDLLYAAEFHYGVCTVETGPRGGRKVKQDVYRRSGRTLTRKRDPGWFDVPLKRGIYPAGRLQTNCAGEDLYQWHTAADCPLRNGGTNAGA